MQTRIRLVAAPTRACTGRRLTFQRRLVTLWAWLMRFPACGFLPQISHCCAMTTPEEIRSCRANLDFTGSSADSAILAVADRPNEPKRNGPDFSEPTVSWVNNTLRRQFKYRSPQFQVTLLRFWLQCWRPEIRFVAEGSKTGKHDSSPRAILIPCSRHSRPPVRPPIPSR